MTPESACRSIVRIVWATAFALTLAPAFAQEPGPAAPTPPPAPQAVALGELAARADADESLADRIERHVETTDTAPLAQRLAALEASHQRLLKTLRTVRVAELPIRRLTTLERHWRFLSRELRRWRSDWKEIIDPISGEAEQLARRRADWDATLAASDGESPWTTRARQARTRIDAAERSIAAPSAALLKLGRNAQILADDFSAGLDDVRRQIKQYDRDLLRLDAPPLWVAATSRNPSERAALTRQGLAVEGNFGNDYNARYGRGHVAVLVVLALALPLLLWVSRRTRARALRESVPEHTLAVLSRPFSTWIVLYVVVGLLFNWDGPVLRQQLALLAAWIPVLRLMPTRVRQALGPWSWLSAVFYALNLAITVAATDALAYRRGLLVLSIALLLTMLVLTMLHRRRGTPGRAGTWSRGLLVGSALLAAVAIGANVVGNVALATVLTDGLLDATYFALALAAAGSVIRALSDVVWRRSAAAMPERISARASSLHRAGLAVGGLAMAVLWLIATLNAFRILQPVYDALQRLLGFQVSFGGVSLTLGNVVLFGLCIWVSWWLARTLRELLAEDVLPNVSLPRGVAHSVSSLSYYALIALGFLVALAVSGFEVSQLAIVFGALGVGVGLGLQDVVKNFVSGIILMVERPIQPDDVVEVSGVTGRVREIGLRATRLITFDGADVVVPNGSLLADQLTNWTLSTSSRRIDLNVGVAYGTDPELVLRLLRDVAARTEGLLSDPAPAALFVGFGASSLDFTLRGWTHDAADWFAIRSRMGLLALAALRDAGIVIPFPQHDLHLRSLSPEWAAALTHRLSPTEPRTP